MRAPGRFQALSPERAARSAEGGPLSLARRALLGTLASSALPGGLGSVFAMPATPGQTVRWPQRLRLLDGGTLEGAQLSQSAVLVVFFSTTCPFCARHNQHVRKLALATHGQPLRVLGVAHDRDHETVRRYLAAKGLDFAVTLDQQPMHEALSMRRVIPLSCVVDARGVLREVIPGEMFEDDVMELARWARA